jgi:hypothetical protein
MKQFIFAFIVAATAAGYAPAQGVDGYKKVEFFAGFSNGQIDKDSNPVGSFRSFLTDSSQFNGFEVSAVYNVSRYVGIKGDVSATFGRSRFSLPITTGTPPQNMGFDTKSSLYNFLGGVQIKDNASKSRLKPFAHALAGVGYERMKVKNVTCPPGISCSIGQGGSSFGLAGALGGGLDTRINKKLDLRAIQIDYNPIKFDERIEHNARFSTGIVF